MAHSLVELKVAGNQLRELPKSISDLQNLEIFDAKRNKLVALPIEMGCLSKLLKCDLEDNMITRVGSFFSSM